MGEVRVFPYNRALIDRLEEFLSIPRNLDPSQSAPRSTASLWDDETGENTDEFEPLSAQQAQEWRGRQVDFNPLQAVMWQIVWGALLVLGVFAGWGPMVGVSFLHGCLAFWLPSLWMARRMVRAQSRSQGAATALAGFFGMELLKVALAVALLSMAVAVPWAVSWPALLVGLIVALKLHVMVSWRLLRQKRKDN
jgi:ATP synthase protein I